MLSGTDLFRYPANPLIYHGQILPEKFHGLTDTDIRYRQRYVDLIMNSDVKDTFVKRSKVLSSIRKYLDSQGFMEVETPMLVSNAGGAAARPFETHFNALNEDLKLRISLELYLKRLIVGGMERVYEIGRVFRNEGLDTRHNPEFTLMELYQAYTDYHGMMDLTENLYRYVAKEVTGSEILTYGEHEMDLSKPFERITMVDAVKKYANVDFNEIHTAEEAKKLADEHHIEYEARHKKGDILNLFFEEYVEEHPAGRRHADAQCIQEIFVGMVRLCVPGSQQRFLCLKTFLLIDGIIQLGISIGHFPTVHKEFKTFHILRIVRFLFG